MTEFKHSIVLFSGDDGLPLEFNIRNTVEKVPLKSMIEHGGGLCTLSDEAIHIVSPGTRVLNVDREKKLISSRYIFECVNENCLLDFDDYVIKITKVETSDISEEDSIGSMGKNILITEENNVHHKEDENKTSNLNETTLENHNEHYPDNDLCREETTNCKTLENPESLISKKVEDNSFTEDPNLSSTDSDISKYLSPQKHIAGFTDKPIAVEGNPSIVHNISDLSDILDDAVAVIPETESNHDVSVLSIESNKSDIVDRSLSITNNDLGIAESPIHAVVVSSSQNLQQPVDGLDGFDNFLLSKLHEKPNGGSPPPEQENSLSQSYTVSSSADAQVSAKSTPPEENSVEMFAAVSTAAAPDSASQNSQPSERNLYIKSLEEEVGHILQKPSPKSIQDKICLVKYICCVKKLPPAAVLQSLQNL